MTDGSQCVTCGRQLAEAVPLSTCPQCLGRFVFQDDSVRHRRIPPVSEVQKLFPQVQVLELIGSGGMGSVYRATQPSLGRDVAVKLLDADFVDEATCLDERFVSEARILARVQHPYIVSVYDFGQAGSFLYLLLKYVPGGNLRELMEAERLPIHRILDILAGVCDAVDYAHQKGVIHRDIKPENVLLDEQGRVKVADFGLARPLRGSELRLTGSAMKLGTAYYVAPEQAESMKVDARADLYSVGVVMYEMLTGELPVGNFRAPSSKRPEARGALDRIVLKALESEATLRYQTAGEMRRDLERARADYPDADPSVAAQVTASMTRKFRLASGAVFTAWALWAGLLLKGTIVRVYGLAGSVPRSAGESLALSLLFLLVLVVGFFWFRLLPGRYGTSAQRIGWPVYRTAGGVFVAVAAAWLVLLGCAVILESDRVFAWVVLLAVATSPLVGLAVPWLLVRREGGVYDRPPGRKTAVRPGNILSRRRWRGRP